MTMKLVFTESQSADCPPADVYVLELKRFGEFHERASLMDPETMQTQCQIYFDIVDFDYDPDVDDRDWNGATVSDYWTFFRKGPDGVTKESWKSPKSNAYALINALLGRKVEDGEDIDLAEFVGKRIKANVAPKDSGWPKISSPVAYKAKKRRKVEEDDEDENPFLQQKAG